MPGPSHSHQVADLSGRVHALDSVVMRDRAVTELAVKNAEERISYHERLNEQLQTKLSDALSKLAAVEQRCVSLEKHTDRTWQVWLALIVAGIGLVVSLVKK